MDSTVVPARRENFARRLTDATSGAFDVVAAYLGLRLGFYRSLADEGPATAAELAGRTATNERLVREWLEQQAATEVLDAKRDEDAETWRFALPDDHAAVLLDPDALDGMGGTVQALLADLAVVPRLVDSFRTGRGIPYADFGPDEAEGQAASTRPIYRTELPGWFAAMPEVSARLAGGTARVLDIGCGLGWSGVSIAKAFPTARVDGVDLDAASIEAAQAVAEQEGVSDRVHFEARDAASLAGAGYDVATMFEMLHDLALPVEALRAAREALAPGGVVLVARDHRRRLRRSGRRGRSAPLRLESDPLPSGQHERARLGGHRRRHPLGDRPRLRRGSRLLVDGDPAGRKRRLPPLSPPPLRTAYPRKPHAVTSRMSPAHGLRVT